MNLPTLLLWGFAATVGPVHHDGRQPAPGLHAHEHSVSGGNDDHAQPRSRDVRGPARAHDERAAFALSYALVFESWHRATWWLGAPIGLVHGMFVLVVAMPIIPGMHPRMVSEYFGPTPNRRLQPPGFLALNYGRRTPVVTLLAHLVYGAILGAFYRLA